MLSFGSGRTSSAVGWALSSLSAMANTRRQIPSADDPEISTTWCHAVRFFTKEGERDRLLLPDEEEGLFEVSSPHRQALMIAALDTSCRVGELLSL
jgi:hypothetical protein